MRKINVLIIINMIIFTAFTNAYEIKIVREDPLQPIRYLGWISDHEAAYCLYSASSDNIVVYKDLTKNIPYEKLIEFSERIRYVGNDNEEKELFVDSNCTNYIFNKITFKLELLSKPNENLYLGDLVIPDTLCEYNIMSRPDQLTFNSFNNSDYSIIKTEIVDHKYSKIFKKISRYEMDEGLGYFILGTMGIGFYEVQFDYPEILDVIQIDNEYGYVDIKKLDENLYLGMFYREDIESDDEYSRCSLRIFNREGEIFLDYKDYLLVNSHGQESFYLSPDHHYIIAFGSKTLGNHKTLIFELFE